MAQVAPGFLEQRLIEVSDLVRHDLREVLDALARGDSAVAQRVIEADDEIDRLCLALDRDAEILLVGKVVPARDIALVLASTRIARNLERMADQCVTIAKLVQAGGNDEPGSDLGIMTAEVAAVHVWAPTGTTAGFDGHVIRQAAETGSRPD